MTKLRFLNLLIISLFSFNLFSMGIRLPKFFDPGDPKTEEPVPNPEPEPAPPEEPSEPSNPEEPNPVPEPENPSSQDIGARWEGIRTDGKLWSEHAYREIASLGPSLLDTRPADYASFCAEFPTLSDTEKKEFYVYLLSAMSHFESFHKPSLKYTENFKDQNGRFIISRGLLQLSIESGNGYGCGLKSGAELHDPYVNLSCAIRILNRWVGRDGRIAGKISGKWRGGARYWSVLRTSSKVSQIKAWSKSYCANRF